MKLWVLVSLLLAFNVVAQDKVFTDKPAHTDKGISENIVNLSNQICLHYRGDSTKVAKKVQFEIGRHMKKYENIPNATPTQMIHFLNRNKHYMTCGDDNINYMMESFRHGAYDQLFNVFLFDYLLVDDDSLYVDINVISYAQDDDNTPPETLLDYMDREAKNRAKSKTTRKEINRLISFFEGDLGGKRYRELSAQEKQAGLDAHHYQKKRDGHEVR